jgi:hypothetical protein
MKLWYVYKRGFESHITYFVAKDERELCQKVTSHWQISSGYYEDSYVHGSITTVGGYNIVAVKPEVV